MSMTQEQLHLRLANVLAKHVEPIFKPGMKFALICRFPGNDECDVIVTDDSLDELAALLARSAARQEMPPC